MPPKPRFTKEEVVATALEIVSQKGLEALTAHELKTALNSSASPIFTLFNSMREIQDGVCAAAMRRFETAVKVRTANVPLFKQVGINMVGFAVNEPKLYRLLFMSENGSVHTFDELLCCLGKTASDCIDMLVKDYALSGAQAKVVFENVWIYTYGVGALCATGVCRFSEDEISNMLSTQFCAMLKAVKSDDRIG